VSSQPQLAQTAMRAMAVVIHDGSAETCGRFSCSGERHSQFTGVRLIQRATRQSALIAFSTGTERRKGRREEDVMIRTMVMLVAIAALVGCGGASTPAAIPTGGGRIAFVSYRAPKSEIYTMNADGSDLTRLTVSDAVVGSPSWSPDGERITFERNLSDQEIYVMSADGSGLTNLTNDPAQDRDPSWSPDGKHIAFASDRGGNYDVYLMKVDGSGLTRLTDSTADERAPSWSPDGERIVFETNLGGNHELLLMSSDGSEGNGLTTNPDYDGQPAWWP
jgi:Tol biopolymer transport system component